MHTAKPLATRSPVLKNNAEAKPIKRKTSKKERKDIDFKKGDHAKSHEEVLSTVNNLSESATDHTNKRRFQINSRAEHQERRKNVKKMEPIILENISDVDSEYNETLKGQNITNEIIKIK